MSLLFSSTEVGGLTLRNRIVMSPMASQAQDSQRCLADTGRPGEATIAYYAARSREVGMVIVEHTYVTRRGKAHKGQLGLDNDAAIPAFTRLAQAIKGGGAIAAVQLSHVGAAGSPDVIHGIPLGPSSETSSLRSGLKPRSMTREEIHEVEDHFAAAALRAKLAGFDAVEIHAAHRYLACQFLSPITNARTDKYGGSLQNRARFLLEVVAKVKKWVGRCFPVFVRLGSIDSVAGGTTPQDAARVAEMLQGSGVAMIDVSGGIMDKWPISMNTVWFAQVASTIKQAVALPVMVTGGITNGVLAENVLQDGSADLIGVGRALLRDQDWVRKQRDLNGGM